jgi:alpha-amylase/alpha-mannosidase (GH57 family)
MPFKAFSIHGHFYQPPRDDPLTGEIPDEPGAAPYKNWNERILHECYQPNARLKNFSRMSFNVGPTLLSWMQNQDLNTYQQILNQEQINLKRYGVGNAMAQTYNHTILPLASSSDKNIQISWGIADFKHRFGHSPQGMWLPEAAVDDETLSLMSKNGIEFTILAPWQADLDQVDTNVPYKINIPGDGSIKVFFYQRDLSTKISFEPKATENADLFAKHELASYYSTKGRRNHQDQFILLASDGELYGHHQPFREQFLSQLLNGAGDSSGLISTYPALWLKTNPPVKTIRIRERTSWSCHHGITRWSGECACTSLDGRWKSHLRYALNRLATSLDALYYENVYPLIPKPRVLRQRYIHVMLGEIQPQDLISEMASHPLTSDQVWRIYLLLESQRERQRIFTSCGWFFEDFDRIEPQNVIAYAAQAVRLAYLATGDDLSAQTYSDLKHVVSPSSGLRADQRFNEQLLRSWVAEDHLSISGLA